ncbi:MAG: tetratricopeptide repeat protein [Rhizonema sp. PD37]|nr:tetratricopeptide repeat protein [Rhizonema sp. PD37]
MDIWKKKVLGKVVSELTGKATKFIPRAMTILVIVTPVSGTIFPVHAQIQKTVGTQAFFNKFIGVSEEKTQIISLQSDQSLFLLSQGNSRFGLGDYVGAITDYTQAVQLNPNNAAAYYNRGEVRSKLGDKKGAIADLKKAVDIFRSKKEQHNYQDALNHLKILQKLL